MRRSVPVFFACASLAVPLSLVGCEPTRDRSASGPSSSSIAVSGDDNLLYIASEDHGQLLIVDRASREVLHRVPTGKGANHVVEVDERRAVVTNRYAHTVTVVDTQAGEALRSIQVGVEPYGLAVVDERTVAVTLAGEKGLALVDVQAGEVEARADLGTPDPRGVARVEDGRFAVTHLTAGVLSWVSEDLSEVEARPVETPFDDGPALHPNHLRTITVTPDGERVVLAHSQANTEPVRAPLNEEPIFIGDVDGGETGGCGYSGCAAELGAVTPAVTEVDADFGRVIVPERHGPGETVTPDDGTRDECFDCAPPPSFAPPSVLNPFDLRFEGADLNSPVAVAIVDGGRGQLVVHQGSRNVLLLRRPLRGRVDDVLAQFPVGHGATGIALTHDGQRAYVWNQFDGSVSEFEVPAIPNRQPPSQTRLAEEEPAPVVDGTRRVDFEPVEVSVFPARTVELVEDALDPDVSLGRVLFHDALNPGISTNGSISCASCHPDGRADGRTWQFTFGPRNTPQLGGGILDTAPFHWPGDVETHRDLNTMTVQAFMGGGGLEEDQMDAIGAFIDSIPAAPSPAALEPALTEQQQRGQALFLDETVGCTQCHFGEHFTDNQSWDIGTQAGDHDIREFQTPVLHGLARSAPYLHDGSQPTLRSLVFDVVATDRMGRGSHLSEAELEDLAAYLQTL